MGQQVGSSVGQGSAVTGYLGGGECLQRLFWFLGDAFECQHLLGSPGDLAKMQIGKLLPRQGPPGIRSSQFLGC